MLQSFPYYVQDQVERAREEKAPQNVTYRGSEYDKEGAVWHTFDEMAESSNKEFISNWVKEYLS